MQISAKELRHLASDVDEQHHEAMRDFTEATREVHSLVAASGRRRFMQRAGVAGVGAAVLSTVGGSLVPFTRLVGVAGAQGLTDTVIAGYAQSVELAAVAAYTYAAALTLLSDPTYAAATSTILPIEAQHATVLTMALEGGPDELFPTGAFESTALGDGTDPTKGLDPAVFG